MLINQKSQSPIKKVLVPMHFAPVPCFDKFWPVPWLNRIYKSRLGAFFSLKYMRVLLYFKLHIVWFYLIISLHYELFKRDDN